MQLHELSALDAAAAIRRREISPVELVEHALDRVARLDPQVGAFVTVTAESARTQAAAAERLVREAPDGAALPPLLGVPTAIKDLNRVAGVPTAFGSRVFAGWIAPEDDHVVTLLRAAGAISIGKTATPEFGLPCYTETDIGPPTRTPWDLTRSAGGSSGGAAAAVASGFVPIAQGSDGGGSIRIPASACGLVGLKTSRGRISKGPLDYDAARLAVYGPLARTVRDAAAFLDAVAIPQPGDPDPLPPLASGGTPGNGDGGTPAKQGVARGGVAAGGETFGSWCARDPGRLRIGRYVDSPMGCELDPQVRAAWEAASELLAGLGHEIVEVSAPIPPEAVEDFETVWAVSACGMPVPTEREGELRPLTRYLREQGRAISGPRYAAALGSLNVHARRGIAASAHVDAVLTPTLALLPRPIGWFAGDGTDPAADFDRQKRFTPYTAMYNTTGQPAISVPLAHSAPRASAPSARDDEPVGGLPIGMMLVGRPGADAPLLALAAQLEAASGWVQRHPPIWEQ